MTRLEMAKFLASMIYERRGVDEIRGILEKGENIHKRLETAYSLNSPDLETTQKEWIETVKNFRCEMITVENGNWRLLA